MKKHNALSFHRVREAAALKIIKPLKIPSKDNFTDIMTKSIGATLFIRHIYELMFRLGGALPEK